MKRLFTALLLLTFTSSLTAQSLYFPPTSGNQWETVSPETLGWCPDKVDTLLNYLEARNSKAFILLKDGKIVLEEYFGTFTQDSVWYWASAGKTLTAFNVGLAQQDGDLDINDPTSDYLGTGWTVCPPAKEDLITVKHQLSMTTGLDDAYSNDCTLDTCLQYLADAGMRWSYHNGPYTLLDSVMYYATGQTLNSFLFQKLTIPTGISGAYVPVGYNNVFFSKARSMARFGLLALNEGNWNGNQIMTDANYFNEMVSTSQLLNLSYGYLWWLNGKASFMLPTVQSVFPGSLNPTAPDDLYMALGKNGQLINVVPSQNLVFIRMGNAPNISELVAPSFNDTIWQHLNDLMCANTSIETDQLSEHVDVKLFPNPAGHNVQVVSTEPITRLQLYNNLGQAVLNEELNGSKNINLDVSQLPSGVYMMHTELSNGTFTREKLITQ